MSKANEATSPSLVRCYTAELDKLITNYGNAMFDCGEHPESGGFDEYHELTIKAKDARDAITDYLKAV